MSDISTLGKIERTVIHLEIKNKDGELEHHYFGSMANLYEFYTPKELGITYGSLKNFGLSKDKPYQNAKCTIRKGLLLSKNTNRGKKKVSDKEKQGLD